MTDETKPSVGAIDLDSIEVVPYTGREKYNWKAIKKAIEDGKAYILPDDAKKPSIVSGLSTLKLEARVTKLKDSETLVVVPKETPT